MVLRLHSRGSSQAPGGAVLPKHHVALDLLAASTQCYFGSYPARPKASHGPCLKMPKPKRHLALGMQRKGSRSRTTWCPGCPPLGGNLSSTCPNVVFFHSNNSFLKFINDDNNNYTLKILMKIIIFTIQIIIFLVAII